MTTVKLAVLTRQLTFILGQALCLYSSLLTVRSHSSFRRNYGQILQLFPLTQKPGKAVHSCSQGLEFKPV